MQIDEIYVSMCCNICKYAGNPTKVLLHPQTALGGTGTAWLWAS